MKSLVIDKKVISWSMASKLFRKVDSFFISYAYAYFMQVMLNGFLQCIHIHSSYYLDFKQQQNAAYTKSPSCNKHTAQLRTAPARDFF